MSDITETTELGEHAVEHGPDDHPGDHWSDLKFVYLAIGLAVITAIEVALSYINLRSDQ